MANGFSANSSPKNTTTTATVAGTAEGFNGPLFIPANGFGNPPIVGRRTENPLSKFSSYTYQLSLYMITPAAYAAFIASGRRDISILNSTQNTATNNPTYPDGAYLIAQSGGFGDITNNNNISVRRAPGMENFDFNIDNLQILTRITGKATQEAANITDYNFNIYEPYGFSFLTRLKYAMNVLANAGSGKMSNTNSTFRQFFILGIRFQGYDENGQILTGNTVFANDTKNVAGNSSGVFERFFDIFINDVKFTLDGRLSTYQCTAAPVGNKAFSVTLGRVNNKISIVGSTVGEMIESLKNQLNSAERISKQNFNQTTPNVYDFEFSEEAKSSILKAKIKDSDKGKSQPSTVNNSSDVNAGSDNATAYNSTVKKIEIAKDTTILQAIQLIIKQSEYFSKSAIEVSPNPPNDKTKTYDVKNTDSNTILRSYNVGAIVVPTSANVQLNDWAYNIKYLIQTYDTPAVDSVYANKVSKYYGPHKRYQYWFTGKNTEVISFELNLNNLYYNTAVANFPINEDLTKFINAPIVTNKQDNQSRINSLNYQFGPQNSYLTSLYDPYSLVNAKLRILGDPDYLMQDSPTGLQGFYDKFYENDGYTVNPNGGQVFVEVELKEAIDYDSGENSEGLLLVNENILFWDYPEELNIKGISFNLIEVQSNFENGKFTQELNMTINPISKSSTTPENSRETARTVNNPRENTQLAGNVGLKRNPPVTRNSPVVESNQVSIGSSQPDNLPPLVSSEGRATA